MTTHLDPQEASRLINEEGALLIDVREPDAHARERIPNAKLVPLSRLTTPMDRNEAQQLIFHCRSGSRTAAAAERLWDRCGRRCAHLTCGIGSLEGGRAADSKGSSSTDRNEMMRQVQIAAGSLVLIGVGLGALLHPGLYALSGLVGAGLVFAGTTGTCGMARILALAPWNRMAQA